MRKSFLMLAIVGLLVGVMAAPALAHGKSNPNFAVDVYVTSQGLVYESIVLGELPFVGNARFQKLEPNGVEATLETAYGPGDVGYLGGRWWVDDGDGVMEDPATSGDMYFLCPLVGPGHAP